jgi:lipopolysaccharide export system protein LptA
MRTVIERVLPLVLLLAAGGALAEKADRSRPIQIEADAVRMDDLRKVAVYEGNVILVQGTMNIVADRIDVRQDEEGMSAGEATGRPVRFQQKLEGRDELVEARAKRIEYNARDEVMKLIGDAYLKQGGDELRGGLIVYDVRAESYRAQGAEPSNEQGRVRAMIRPRAKSAGATDGAPAKP